MTRRFTIAMVAGLLVLFAGAIALSSRPGVALAAQGDGGFVNHPSVVPGEPQLGYPVIMPTPKTAANMPRQTYAVDLVGKYIVSGGDFVNVKLQNGVVVTRQYLAVFDINTKALVCHDMTIDDEVLAIAPGPYPGSVVIGGRFNTIVDANGASHNRAKLALIRLDTCTVDQDFVSFGTNSRITELAVSGDRLFVGGDFTTINGKSVANLAELNFVTGQVNTAFDFDFTPHPQFSGRRIVGLEANRQGTRLGIVHRARAIDGINMRGTAVFNISNPANPSITPHRMATNILAYSAFDDIQDGAIAPDFSYFAIAQGTDPASAFVHKIPTTEAAGQFAWRHYMRNSSFGIAASNNAIYVAGHFCKIDGGQSPTAIMSPNTHSACAGAGLNDNCGLCNGRPSVWRSQLAALSPVDGSPLTWNPGVDALVGGRALTVTNRGLLVGYDGQFTHGAATYRRVGTTVFFDFGSVNYPTLDATCTVDSDGAEVSISWSPGTSGYTFWLYRNGQYVDVPFGATSLVVPAAGGNQNYQIRPWDWHGQGPAVSCTAAGNVAPQPGAPQCAGQSATISGTAGDDNLIGTNGDDVIYAGGGDDFINGHGGNDVICGAGGNDQIIGGAGNDEIYGGDGQDFIDGGDGNDSLNGGDERDRIFGGPGTDWLFGGAMIDALHGGTGNDTLFGNQGADRLNGNGGRDTIRGGSGSDRIQGGGGNDTILGGGDSDRCAGRKFGSTDAAGDSLAQCEVR